MSADFAQPYYEIASDDVHEKVFAEVNIDGCHQLIIALENKQVGPIFEFYSKNSKIPTLVRSQDLLNVIADAIIRLEAS